jgi:dienelactone hydrolase
MLLIAAAYGTLSPPVAAKDLPREPSIADLFALRTIDSLSLSPDHKRLAFRVVRPNVENNRIDDSWFTLDLATGQAESIGRAGIARMEPMFDVPVEERPIWLADGRSILVARLGTDGVQVHALAPGGGDQTVTADGADIESFNVSDDGRTLTYATRASHAEIAAAEDSEARGGIHFDQTILTEGSPLTRGYLNGFTWTSLRRRDGQFYRPAHEGPVKSKTMVLAGAMRAIPRPPTKSAAIEFAEGDLGHRRLAWGGGQVGFLEVQDGAKRAQPRYQVAFLQDGQSQPCDAAQCIGDFRSFRLLAVDRGGSLYVLREDDGSARTKLYRLDPKAGRSQLVLDADGSLDGGAPLSPSCLQNDDELICVHAKPTSPPRLVRVNLASGAMRQLFDPNEDLRSRAYPRTRPIVWQDRNGRTMNGVLVMPAKVTKPAPLVISTYRCRGFLHGGTAQVAPEIPLAQQGFVVLCANANPANDDLPSVDPRDPALKSHKADIEGYRAAIDLLASEGLIDPRRVGIAGHSYSANTIAYAVSHTDLFRAAVIGSGVSIDAASYWVTAPTADAVQRRKDVLDNNGLPHPDHDPGGIWAANGPSLNAGHVKAAVLLQPPETEYLMATQFYAAIQDHGGIADMVVYPGAAHMFGRFPQQLITRAQRTIDWFKFWLAGDACNTDYGHPEWQKFAKRAGEGVC